MNAPRRRKRTAQWRASQIFAQQELGFVKAFLLADQCDRAIKERARVGRRNVGALLRHDNENVGLIVLHGMVANVVDELDGCRMELEGFWEVGRGGGKIAFFGAG